jgi:hypothetical protein
MQTIITTFEESNSNIKFTVALPIYNSKKIAWISLESLIRQENINFDWELIVYEEIHSESVCPEILEEYKDRLIDKIVKELYILLKKVDLHFWTSGLKLRVTQVKRQMLIFCMPPIVTLQKID